MYGGRRRYKGIQTKLQNIGDDGCLFLSLCSVAEDAMGRPVDLIDAVNACFMRHLLRSDYYVHNSVAVLEAICGPTYEWTTYTDISPSMLTAKRADNEYTIVRYYNPRTKLAHFRRRDVDTLESSVTVEEGAISEVRVYSYKRLDSCGHPLQREEV